MVGMTNNKKILIVLGRYSKTGVPRNRMRLARELANRGHLVRIFILCGDSAIEKSFLCSKFEIINAGKASGFRALPALTRQLRAWKPDYIISAEENVNLISIISNIISRCRSRISISFHVPPELNLGCSPADKRFWVVRLGRMIFPQADLIIAIAPGMKESISSVFKIDAGRISVIANPVVDEGLFCLASQCRVPKVTVAQKYHVVAAGTLSKRKGFADLIRAVAIGSRDMDVGLVILGEGPERNTLEMLAEDLGVEDRVYLVGAVENPFAWMAQANVFVLSSYFEGLPTVLIEAMACGCPVVSTDCHSGPRDILHNGRYGPLVKPRDVHGLANAITSVVLDPMDGALLRGRADVYKASAICERYLEAFSR